MVAVGDLRPQLFDFFKPLLAFFGRPLAFFGRPLFRPGRPLFCPNRPLFRRFSRLPFSCNHHVTPYASESAGYAPMNHHLVKQVEVDVPTQTR